jgi:preprotein translocase subunit SecB
MSRPIKNILDLDRAIRELKKKQKDLESKLDTNMQTLKSNYFGMTLNTVFGSKNKTSGAFWTEIVGRFIENEKLQNSMSKLAETLADKVGEGLNRAFTNDKQ